MKKLIFVCTGNTCRSPMAAAIFNALCGSAEADSCGLAAAYGMPASPGAVRAVPKYGGDLSGHLSKPATLELLSGADAIICMTSNHAEGVKLRFPEFSGIVRTLGCDIADPYGGTDELYAETAAQIHNRILELIREFEA